MISNLEKRYLFFIFYDINMVVRNKYDNTIQISLKYS